MHHKPMLKTLKNSGIEKETQYQPQLTKYKKKSKEVIKNIFPNLNFGKWNSRQNEIYIQFLLEYRTDFQVAGSRRRNKVFMKMQKAIGTRCADQCRSHHQKVENFASSRNVDDLIQFVSRKTKLSSSMKNRLQGITRQKIQPIKEVKQEYIEENKEPVVEENNKNIILRLNFKDIPVWRV